MVTPQCTDTTCSGHGSCSVSDGNLTCACDSGYTGNTCGECATGYHRDGENCVADEQCANDGSTCSGHGSCSVSNGSATCTCDPGYTGSFCDQCATGYHRDGADCVADEQCADDGSTCHEAGSCTIQEGRIQCSCATGYAGDRCQDCAEGFERNTETEACEPACGANPGEILCGDTCVDSGSDPYNCGICGEVCNLDADETCVAGLCRGPDLLGNTCDQPAVLVADDQGILTGAGDLGEPTLTNDIDYAGCQQMGVHPPFTNFADQVWLLEVPSDGSYDVTVTPAAGATVDPVIVVFDSSGCDSASCLGHYDSTDEGEAETLLLADLEAGDTLHLAVDSWASTVSGAYTITASKRCENTCDPQVCGVQDACGNVCTCQEGVCNMQTQQCEVAPGDTCSTALPLIPVSETVLAGSGQLGDASQTNAVSTAGCEQLGQWAAHGDGKDQVWAFSPSVSGDYLLTLTATVDMFLQVFNGASCDPDSCIGYKDDVTGNLASETMLLADVLVGEQFHIVVDTFDDHNGQYSLAVQRLDEASDDEPTPSD